MHICIDVGACANVYMCLCRQEKGDGFPGTSVTGESELSDMCARGLNSGLTAT